MATVGQKILVKLVRKLGADHAAKRLGISASLMGRFLENSLPVPDNVLLRAVRSDGEPVRPIQAHLRFRLPAHLARCVNEEQADFAARLDHIEKQAAMAAEDLPASVINDRILDIAVTARLLRMRLDVAAKAVLPPAKSRR